MEANTLDPQTLQMLQQLMTSSGGIQAQPLSPMAQNPDVHASAADAYLKGHDKPYAELGEQDARTKLAGLLKQNENENQPNPPPQNVQSPINQSAWTPMNMGGGPNNQPPNQPVAKNNQQDNSTPVDANQPQVAAQPQQPQQQQPQNAGLQILQALLQHKPNFGDYMAAGLGIKTPGYQMGSSVGPDLMQHYAQGQMPLTTEQQMDLGVKQYTAKREALANYANNLDKQDEDITKAIENATKQRGLVNAAWGGPGFFNSGKLVEALQTKQSLLRQRKTDISDALKSFSSEVPGQASQGNQAKQMSQNQEQYRTTASGNKFKLK